MTWPAATPAGTGRVSEFAVGLAPELAATNEIPPPGGGELTVMETVAGEDESPPPSVTLNVNESAPV
jgi:hypothetical protein